VAEIIAERTGNNPVFPQLVAEAEARRKLARRLAALREKRALSQTVVAARMRTSASVVSKLEAGGDVKMSTFQRYCAQSVKRAPRCGASPPCRSLTNFFVSGLGAREAGRRAEGRGVDTVFFSGRPIRLQLDACGRRNPRHCARPPSPSGLRRR